MTKLTLREECSPPPLKANVFISAKTLFNSENILTNSFRRVAVLIQTMLLHTEKSLIRSESVRWSRGSLSSNAPIIQFSTFITDNVFHAFDTN